MNDQQDKRTTQDQLAIITGLLVVALLFSLHILVWIAAGLGVVFMFIPPLKRLILKAWLGLAEILGRINAVILLTLVYFLFLLPLALLSRLGSKDPLKIKKKTYTSLFEIRNHTFTKEDFDKMW